MIQDQTGYNQINPDHGELKLFLPARKKSLEFYLKFKLVENDRSLLRLLFKNDLKWPRMTTNEDLTQMIYCETL